MPLYTIAAYDKPDVFDLRAATRAAHLDHLAAHADRVRLGGPWLDAEGRSVGSFLVVEAADLAHARALADGDPYARAGLFARVEVTPWRPVVGGFGDRRD